MQTSDNANMIEFRVASSDDISAVVELIERAYRGDASRAGWTTEADLLGGQRTDAGEIATILADRDAQLLLATRSEGIIGCVLLRREATNAYIGMLAVNPNLQTMGLGRRLLEEAERRARLELGLCHARMTVIEQRQELIAWYCRRGYVPTSQVEPFPYGNPRFGLPKRDDLRFVVLRKELVTSLQK